MAKAKPTPAELTVAQLSAVDLLAGGKNDSETAEALNLHRVTVTRWRNYSPEFRVALAERRRAVWGSAADKLRALVPKALDTLAAELEHGEDKARVALAVVKLAAASVAVVPDDPTDPDAFVRQIVAAERKAHKKNDQDADEDLDCRLYGLPTVADHLQQVRERLARLAPSDPPPPEKV